MAPSQLGRQLLQSKSPSAILQKYLHLLSQSKNGPLANNSAHSSLYIAFTIFLHVYEPCYWVTTSKVHTKSEAIHEMKNLYDADFCVALQADTSGYNFRTFWVDARSTHWVHRVMDGGLLQERQFDQTFRMSRNSFRTLQGILGNFLFSILLISL